jgi:hypothetical protein
MSPWLWGLCFGFCQFFLGNVSAAPDVQTESNLSLCIAGNTACQYDLLSEPEKNIVLQALHTDHLNACMRGASCNKDRLSHAERVLVDEALSTINLSQCLSGSTKCRFDFLSPDQRILVENNQLKRNRELCMAGSQECRTNLLSANEKLEMRERYLERNFKSCLATVGTLLPCNLDDLNPLQQEVYQAHQLNQNFQACLMDLFLCNTKYLTDAQIESIANQSGGR